jgi:hypothetical protein
MSSKELLQHKSSIPRQKTNANNSNKTRNDAHRLENAGQRQHTETDLVGQQSKGGVPFCHVAEVLGALAAAEAIVYDGDVVGRVKIYVVALFIVEGYFLFAVGFAGVVALV